MAPLDLADQPIFDLEQRWNSQARISVCWACPCQPSAPAPEARPFNNRDAIEFPGRPSWDPVAGYRRFFFFFYLFFIALFLSKNKSFLPISRPSLFPFLLVRISTFG
jgi:hypothetical protein